MMDGQSNIMQYVYILRTALYIPTQYKKRHEQSISI